MGSKSDNPQLVELGFYAPWFLYRPELKQFCYDVQVQIAPAMR